MKWKLYKSDWTTFSQLCDLQLNKQSFLFDSDPVSQFNSILLEIADRTIPKSSTNHQRIPKPWLTEECKEAVLNRKRLLRRFKTQLTPENLTLKHQYGSIRPSAFLHTSTFLMVLRLQG